MFWEDEIETIGTEGGDEREAGGGGGGGWGRMGRNRGKVMRCGGMLRRARCCWCIRRSDSTLHPL